MKRDERVLVVAVAFVCGGFSVLFVFGVEDALARQSWFSNGSNLIQWISGPMTLAAVAAFFYRYFCRRCAVPWCPRSGDHPVAGCLHKVCTHHHTADHHRLVHDLHAEAHRLTGRLGWGETHNSRTAQRATTRRKT